MSFGEAIVGLFALIVFGVAFFVFWILISSIIGTALGGAMDIMDAINHPSEKDEE